MDMEFRTIPAELQHWATTDPKTPGFIFVDCNFGRCELSRADLYRLASRYAAILRRNGVHHGSIVCNTLPNSPERLVTDLGILLAGGVAMNGQVFLADGNDFVGSLKDAAAFAVVLDPQQPKGAAGVLERRTHTEHGSQVDYDELPALKKLFEVCFASKQCDKLDRPLFRLLEQESESYVADVKPSDMADVWTTSGSTGFSKLVPRSHESVLLFGNHFFEVVEPREGDIYYNDRALGWAGGFPGVFLTHGTTRVAIDVSKGLPEDVIAFEWDVILQERCNVALFVPTQLLQMIDLWHRRQREEDGGQKDWKFRVISSGGQPLRRKHMEAIGRITDCIHVLYGSTESGCVTTKVVTKEESYDDCNNGRPMGDTQVRVVSPELEDRAVGELGQIVLKSSQLFTAYLNNPAASAKAFTADGWHRTGDVGYVDDKGDLFIVCREAFSIMRGPYLLYPGWLERRIGACPGVGDIMIVPVPDPTLHQELCACVVPSPGADLTSERLKEFCEGLFLTSEKSEMTAVPGYFLFFDKFPTTLTGKTCRRSTTVVARKRLGIEDSVK